MREYAADRLRSLLGKFVFEVHRASKSRDPDAIHDLRVAIRRFGEGLRVFRQFFPEKGVKKVRKKLRGLMDQAAAVRDKDIALELLAEAGVCEGSLVEGLRKERKAAERALAAELKRWARHDFSSKWRESLHLHSTHGA